MKQKKSNFEREIEKALREADDPLSSRVPNHEIEAGWRKQRAELLKRAMELKQCK